MKQDEYVLNRFTTTVLTCDKPTITGRIYPKNLIEKSIIEDPIIAEKLANRMFLGEFPSNDKESYASVDIENIAFSTENLYFEGDELKADIAVLDTPQGKILNKLIDNNVMLTFFCTGEGSVDINNKVTDYKLLSVSAYLKNKD